MNRYLLPKHLFFTIHLANISHQFNIKIIEKQLYQLNKLPLSWVFFS